MTVLASTDGDISADRETSGGGETRACTPTRALDNLELGI